MEIGHRARHRRCLGVVREHDLHGFGGVLTKPDLLRGRIRATFAAVQLEALRLAAVGHEDGAVPGAGEVPAARIVRE